MQFDVSIAMTWILFLALFPISFVWLRRSYRIFIKRNYSEVALKRGELPNTPQKFAWQTGLLNLVAGIVLVLTIIGVVTAMLSYETWSAVAGSTIWLKIILDYAVSRRAHFVEERKK